MLTDTHCHLTDDRFAADRETLIPELPGNGVVRAITIGTGLEDGRAARDLARRFPEIVAATVALDPGTCHDLGEAGFASGLTGLEALLREGGFCGLGEFGLEYHHPYLPRAVQLEQMAAQLDLARSLDLPVVLHIREGTGQGGADAQADALALAKAHPARGLVHSFAGTATQAKTWLDLGYHLAFNGMVTYPRNDSLRAAAAVVPADRLLVETDSPYLAPQAHRGRRNEPAHVRLVAECLADLRGERADDLAAWTTRNACLLFGLPLPW